MLRGEGMGFLAVSCEQAIEIDVVVVFYPEIVLRFLCIDQECLKSWGSYSFALGYKYYLPLYFLSLQKGDTLMANRVAHELRQEAPLLAKDENSGKEI